MLILQAISGPLDQQALLGQFDPGPGTWVVSDLKAKLDIQRRLMSNRDFLSGESVLRASELWRLLLTRLRPDLQVVSKEFAVTLIAQDLASRNEPWTQSPGAPQTAYQYLCQLMPVLSHPEGGELMASWFETHEASRVRWGRWFELCQDLWKGFLERGIVAAPCVSGVLVNEPGFEKVWDRPLMFDLGAELDQVEADLIALLANFVPTTVLQPRPVWRGEYKRTLLAYDILEKKPKTTKTFFSTGDSDKKEFGPREYAKFTTMLAEVKHAVARARDWLDGRSQEGPIPPVPANRIAIVAPDIETYWPALSAYLDEEGVPYQKARLARMHAFPDVTQWLATLRLKAGGHDESDLEISMYDRTESPALAYERFRVLYSAIYSRGDMERSGDIASLFAVELASTDIVSRDAFVAWSLKSLSDAADRTRIEIVFKRLFQECPEITALSVRRWMSYLEEIASKTECRIGEGRADGLACINLVSAENSPSTHMIILGLTESALRQGADTGVLFSDIQSLAYEFGFHLQSPDNAKLEFEARWVTENSSRHLVLCVPETDFDGAVQAPAWLWVKGSRESGAIPRVSVPAPTRWDEIQRASPAWISHYREWEVHRATRFENSLAEDMGTRPLPAYGSREVTSLSASKIEDYLTCPFIFSAKALFRLSDLPSLDLDVDASTRGKLMHALFERLTREPMGFSYTRKELEQIVDLAREQAAVQIYDERLWPSMRQRYAETARRFLEFERDWRETFKETRTLDREVTIEGFVDPVTGDLTREGGPGRLRFSGSIDRVDVDAQGNAAVIDYKSSASGTVQWTKWIENDDLQLLLYSIALERGLTKHEAHQVVSAVYYIARTMDRDKGFKVEDVPQGLFYTQDKKKNKITSEAKARLFNEARAALAQAVKRMATGEFAPIPKTKETCTRCQWSAVCRAPHLNT